MRIILAILCILSLPGGLSAQDKANQLKLDSLNRVIARNASDTTVAAAYLALTELFYITHTDTLIPLTEKAIAIIEKKLPHERKQERLRLLHLKASALNNLGYAWNRKDSDKAISYWKEGLKTAEEIKDTLTIAISCNSLGLASFNKGNAPEALEYYNRALALSEKAGAKKDISITLNNLGYLFKNQGDIPKALEYYHRSLKIREESGDRQGTATSLNNIALVYQLQGDVPKALEYFQKCYKIDEELGDKWGMATTLHNLGRIYQKQGDRKKALEHYNKSLALREDIQDMQGISNSLQNIGLLYEAENDPVKALGFYMRSLEISEKRQNKAGITANLNLIGALYYKKGDLQKAQDYQERSLKLSKELGFPNYTMNAAQSLSRIYRSQGKHQKALEMYELYIQMKDSISNEETRKEATKKQLKYEYEKKMLADSLQFAQAQQMKDLRISEQQAQLQQEQTQRYALYGGLLLVVGLAAVSYRSYVRKKRDSEIITAQKHEVERQKELIEEKNKDILDSIHYARQLQEAILPPLRIWNEHLPESFVLYMPKDIVAGDFYWMERVNGKVLFAAADCTGHGVPGAMVSVVCSNALNRAVKEFQLTDPGGILDKVTELVLETFEKSEKEVKDGMDISLCCFDPHTRELKWAGANNPLWIIRRAAAEEAGALAGSPSTRLQEIRPDKQPVGKFEKSHSFTTHSIRLEEGDTIYIFTDGYADQFGGNKGKKFKYSQLKELLLAIHSLPMEQQKDTLHATIEAWKSSLEQVDDICMIGVQVR